jgi:OmpA family
MTLSKLKGVFEALQEVDVSEIVTSLALGIAKAQEKLDDNSIKQLLVLAEKTVDGKSLIQLGFVPAFYAFEYADISASIHLKMSLNDNLKVDFGLKVDAVIAKGYTKEDADILEASKESKTRTEFKSTKSLLVRASEKKSIKIQNKTISMDQTKGSMSRVEDFSDKMSEAESVSRVNTRVTATSNATNIVASAGVIVNNSRGYIVVNYPTVATKWGILQIKNYNTTNATTGYDVKLNNVAAPNATAFAIGANFADTVIAANAILANLGTTKAIIPIPSKSNTSKTVLEIYFDFNKRDKIDESYSKADIANANISYSNAGVVGKLNAIARLLESDPTLALTIEGHTDSSGPYSYNEALGLDRAETIKKYFTEEKKLPNSISAESKSESLAIGGNASSDIATNPLNNIKNPKFRKVVIKLTADADYILFQGETIAPSNASPKKPTLVNDNGFIKLEEVITGSNTFSFQYGASNFVMGAFVDYAAFTSAFSASNMESKFTHTKVNETIYLLHNESKIEYTAYNADTEEITMEEVKESSSSNSQDQSTYVIDDTVNKNYRLKKSVQKIENPTTVAVAAKLDIAVNNSSTIDGNGSASISVRLKAVLPPAKFTAHVLGTGQ